MVHGGARPRAASPGPSPAGVPDGPAFQPSLLYLAAKMYYDEEATQAEVAVKLGTSRATVSRLLAEARRRGIVQITVHPPVQPGTGDLGEELAAALQLRAVYLSAPLPLSPGANRGGEDALGSALAPALSRALTAAALGPGAVLLVSSGRTVYEVASFDLPRLPGVVVAPTVGGMDQPESWFQTNEIVRRFADRIGGRPTYLFAPALPGPELYDILLKEPSIDRVLHLWPQADVVVTGVGAPPLLRSQFPAFVPHDSPSLREAIGDICSRFFDRTGAPVEFEGSDRLIALPLGELHRLSTVIAVAAGPEKVTPLLVGARAGYFNQLVTDPLTAERLLAAIGPADS